jgi:peptide/nickel transport system ATP-binding protein
MRVTPMAVDPLVSISGLSASFQDDDGRLQALKDVGFDIPRGKTVCLVGESGCGKSVTARAILRILGKNASIDGGKILFEQRNETTFDIANAPEKSPELRRLRGNDITMIFQEPMTAISSFYTVGNQIIEALRRHIDISKAAARARAIEILDAVGMPDPSVRIDSYSFELSGGQRQRAMIAMALVTNPRLLIADEPTTALDVTTQAVILDLVKDLQLKLDMSVLFITHDLGVVAEVADEVVVMYLGEVVETGPVDQIFATPRHPYTRALLSAAPRYGGGNSTRLPVIPGMVPSLKERPSGCAFATRCAHMTPGLCDVSRPELVAGPTRVRCFLDRAGVPEDFEVETPTAPDRARAPMQSDTSPQIALSVESVSKRFVQRSGTFRRTERVTRAVSEVSFDLYAGETLGLVGESGCGKSTLGQTIAGLIDPSDGQVRLAKGGEMKTISHLPEPQRRKVWQDIRFVFQDPFASLNPRMTVFELVSEPLRVGPARIANRQQLQDRVHEVMRRTGLNPDQSDRYPHAFSGGQRQRIGIARALAPNPRIVIADEPVSALDVSVQAQILNLFQDLQEELGLTYLFVSHDLNVVSNISDRVAVMYAGRIVEVAATDQIYHQPRHPYTAALLGAVLTPDYSPTKQDRDPLQGQPPNPANLPQGCAFAPRCVFATRICSAVQPVLEADGEGRLTVCHERDAISHAGIGG